METRSAPAIYEYKKISPTSSGASSGDLFGYDLASGDIDGDGSIDIFVSAPLYDDGKGIVYLYYGSTTGITESYSEIEASDGKSPLDWFGYKFDVFDLNNDGFDDMISSSQNESTLAEYSGAIYIYYGSITGPSDEQKLYGPYGGDGVGFGYDVAGAGDVDGDGFGDFITSMIYNDENNYESYIYYGSTTGIGDNYEIIKDPNAGDRTKFGISLDAAGDVDGDGYGDIVVGAENDQVYDPATRPGAAYIYYGSSSGVQEYYDILLPFDDKTDGFGVSVAGGGDLNGDGYGDVLIGADYSSYGGYYAGGAVFAYYGSSTGISLSPDTIKASDPDSFDYFGSPTAFAGDLDGDGFDDIITGTVGDEKHLNDGVAYVYFGNFSGISDIELKLTASDPTSGLGFSSQAATGIGDTNQDGYDDLLIAANYGIGAVYIFLGAPEDNDGDGVGILDDCDDFDSSVGAAKTYYVDADGDSYGDDGLFEVSCELVLDRVLVPGDCNDDAFWVHPGAKEVCGDGIDNNCDGFGTDADDEDGDGLSSAEERIQGTNPCLADTDGDGLSDGEEVQVWGTDPLLDDTDGDGLSDGEEVASGSDPLVPEVQDTAEDTDLPGADDSGEGPHEDDDDDDAPEEGTPSKGEKTGCGRGTRALLLGLPFFWLLAWRRRSHPTL